MSETTTQAEEVTIQPFKVIRNEIDLTFTEHKVTKGSTKGAIYPAADVTEQNVENVAKWIGLQGMVGILGSFLKKYSQGWNRQASEDGTFNSGIFQKLASDFSVVAETKKVLLERYEELAEQFAKFDTNKILAKAAVNPQDQDVVNFFKLAQYMQAVKSAIDQRSRKSDDTDVDEAVTPV